MTYNAISRRRRDNLSRYKSSHYYSRFAQDLQDYPYAPKILTDGDSWSNFPKRDMVEAIQQLGAFNTLRLGEPGDELLEHILSPRQRERLVRSFSRWQFDLMLFCGGGNDVMGNDLHKYLTGDGNKDNPSSYIKNNLDDTLVRIKEKYIEIINLANCPIIAHGYDYVYPTDKPFQLFVIKRGPWINKAMNISGVPDDFILRTNIMKAILDRFSDTLDALEQEHSNFRHARLLGTLTDAKKYWNDEIHPSARGFRKLSKRIIPIFEQLVPDGFTSHTNGSWRRLSRLHRHGG